MAQMQVYGIIVEAVLNKKNTATNVTMLDLQTKSNLKVSVSGQPFSTDPGLAPVTVLFDGIKMKSWEGRDYMVADTVHIQTERPAKS